MTKAGSTAIQNFLDRSYFDLLEQGILFPRSVLVRRDVNDMARTSGHLDLFRALEKDEVDVFLNECFLHSQKAHTLVLSAENIFHSVKAVNLRKLRSLLSGCDITIVFIARQQDDWIGSRYFESVVKGYGREVRDIDLFVAQTQRHGDLDYVKRLESLVEIMNPVETMVLDYAELTKERRLVTRFCEIIGFESELAGNADEVAVNASEPFPEAIEAHRQLNVMARVLENEDYLAWCWQMRQHYRQLARAGVLRRGYVLPSLPVRASMSQAVAEPNRLLSERYLSGAPFGIGPDWLSLPETQLDTGLVDDIYCFGADRILERLGRGLAARREARGTPAEPGRRMRRHLDLDLDGREAAHLRALCARAGVILEYGGGGTTELAARLPGRLVLTVEHDRDRARALQVRIDEAALPSPAIVCTAKDEAAYAESIWQEPFFRHPDLVLIDTPRVADCLSAVARHITRPVTVLARTDVGVEDSGRRPVREIGRLAEYRLEPGDAGASRS